MTFEELLQLQRLLEQARAEAASIPDALLLPLARQMDAVSSWLRGEQEERDERKWRPGT